jgi:hypothetical protein
VGFVLVDLSTAFVCSTDSLGVDHEWLSYAALSHLGWITSGFCMRHRVTRCASRVAFVCGTESLGVYHEWLLTTVS